MTIAEYIEMLKKFPPYADVVIEVANEHYTPIEAKMDHDTLIVEVEFV